jgi:hypothetical protein
LKSTDERLKKKQVKKALVTHFREGNSKAKNYLIESYGCQMNKE